MIVAQCQSVRRQLEARDQFYSQVWTISPVNRVVEGSKKSRVNCEEGGITLESSEVDSFQEPLIRSFTQPLRSNSTSQVLIYSS